ncbi:MAG: NUDIX domain-containing protein [Clostridia bacterium]|nr:NUDIX domain-containing protein [Clostridia bacterium]
MLNKIIKVRVSRAIGSFDEKKQCRYGLNFGKGFIPTEQGKISVDAYIMGITHPVKRFEGRVIATLRRKDGSRAVIAAAKNQRFVNYQIEDAIAFAEQPDSYRMACYYENSCGAIVFRKIGGQTKYLLIKNCRSSNWGFPKGHMERGEDQLATAKREVLEETGLHIDVFDGFGEDSSYMIGPKVDKSVRIFLATTKDTKTIIQKEEIAAYTWLPFDEAYNALNFANDKQIFKKARSFIEENGLDTDL